MGFVTLDPEGIAGSHICCAISDKKCAAGYQAKKSWLTEQYANGFRFHRLDERGKVFVEYGPGETAWMPVEAPNWLVLGCFWVSRAVSRARGTARRYLLMFLMRRADRGGPALSPWPDARRCIS